MKITSVYDFEFESLDVSAKTLKVDNHPEFRAGFGEAKKVERKQLWSETSSMTPSSRKSFTEISNLGDLGT